MVKQSMLILMGLVFTSVAHALDLNGSTAYMAVFQLNAAVSGSVEAVLVKEGQKIKKGDVLVKLDAYPYNRRLAETEAIGTSLLPLVEIAQLELDRAFELYDRDSLSQVELKNAENKLAQAKGQYQAAQAQIDLAKYNLKQTQIKSPLNGRVVQINVNRGQYVNPMVESTSLLTVTDAHSMKAIASISSEQWSPEILNKPATIIYKGNSFKGQVSYLGLTRVKQSSGISAYEVHVKFKTDKLIPAQMPVEIKIQD